MKNIWEEKLNGDKMLKNLELFEKWWKYKFIFNSNNTGLHILIYKAPTKIYI